MLCRPVIADLIRNPEVKGRAENKTNQPTESPSPLMGEESKARVNKTTPTNRIPSPLTGEESGPVPVLDTGIRG